MNAACGRGEGPGSGGALSRVILVRHGETAGQSSVRYFGATDIELSDLGRYQMRRAAAALAGEGFDAVYASHLRRAREAARILVPDWPPRIVPEFAEIHFGRWEGLTEREIEARDPELFRIWRTRPAGFRYPEGESIAEFRLRVAAGWRRLVSEAPGRVLVVAHKGVIRAIVGELIGATDRDLAAWPVDLASIHVLARREGGPWRSERINDTRHLREGGELGSGGRSARSSSVAE